MQPDTAFWVLSSIAQSSAALAGLTALLLVFVLTQGSKEREPEEDLTFYELLGRFPPRLLAMGTGLYLLAVVVPLGTMGNVVPGDAPVSLGVEVAAFLSIVLIGAGSLALVWSVLSLRGWFETPQDREMRRQWRKLRKGKKG
ncbi:MAG: hypothetical protein ACE5IJ_03325 [Thermoplasmata archaeon]